MVPLKKNVSLLALHKHTAKLFRIPLSLIGISISPSLTIMAAPSLDAYHSRANKRTQDIFGDASLESFLDTNAPAAKRAKLKSDSSPTPTLDAADVKLSSRILASYGHVKDLPPPGASRKADSSASILNRLPSKSHADGTHMLHLFALLGFVRSILGT